tara:strand:+ start:334 stop:813 length:480 start_codon:yes stop_codon:yes gene_type:complete
MDDGDEQPRFDIWSLMHAAAGALITLGFWATGIGWFSLLITVVIELLWELYENGGWKYGGKWLWGTACFKGCIYENYEKDEPRHTVWDVYITTGGGLLAAIFLSTIGLNATSLGLVLGFAGLLIATFIYRYPSHRKKLISTQVLLPIQQPIYNVDGITF